MIEGYHWTIEDTYAAQNMCPYETVSINSTDAPLATAADMVQTRVKGGIWIQSLL